MIPQDQEFVNSGNIQGDCQRAVIASLLDLHIADVPHFAQIAVDDQLAGKPHRFWASVLEFCESHGYEYLTHVNLIYHMKPGVDLYHAISGPSPRGNGMYHCVVGLNGKVFFDPHPSRAGLAGDSSQWKHSVLRKLHNSP